MPNNKFNKDLPLTRASPKSEQPIPPDDEGIYRDLENVM